jgi:hypothetical protein
MRKYLIAGLIVANVALAVALTASIVHIPQAQAQPMGLSGNFLMVSGSILGSKSDIVYMIDLENRQLISMYYDRSQGQVSWVGTRDLTRDLSGGLGGSTERAGTRRRPAPGRIR